MKIKLVLPKVNRIAYQIQPGAYFDFLWVLLDKGGHARAIGDDFLQDGLVQAVLDGIPKKKTLFNESKCFKMVTIAEMPMLHLS